MQLSSTLSGDQGQERRDKKKKWSCRLQNCTASSLASGELRQQKTSKRPGQARKPKMGDWVWGLTMGQGCSAAVVHGPRLPSLDSITGLSGRSKPQRSAFLRWSHMFRGWCCGVLAGPCHLWTVACKAQGLPEQQAARCPFWRHLTSPIDSCVNMA